jgi:hypothetical protein
MAHKTTQIRLRRFVDVRPPDGTLIELRSVAHGAAQPRLLELRGKHRGEEVLDPVVGGALGESWGDHHLRS